MKIFQTGNSCQVNDLACDPAKSRTRPESLSSSLNPSADQLRSQSEALLDTAINIAYAQLINANTYEHRLSAWDEFEALIKQRSPEHVARLERERMERVRKDYGKPTVRA